MAWIRLELKVERPKKDKKKDGSSRDTSQERCGNLYTLSQWVSFEFQWSTLRESQTFPRRLSTATHVLIYPRENRLFSGEFKSCPSFPCPWKRLFVHNSLKTHENVTQRKELVGVYGRMIKTSVQVLPARITKVNHFWPYYPRTFHPEKGRRFYRWFALIQLLDPLTDVAPLWENREIDASLLYSSRYLYF